jgi:hypothetical protein
VPLERRLGLVTFFCLEPAETQAATYEPRPPGTDKAATFTLHAPTPSYNQRKTPENTWIRMAIDAASKTLRPHQQYDWASLEHFGRSTPSREFHVADTRRSPIARHPFCSCSAYLFKATMDVDEPRKSPKTARAADS